MRKTGLFSKLLDTIRVRFQSYYSAGASSAPFNKELYEQETVRAIIDCIASHAAKSEAMHVIVDERGRVREVKRSSPYARLLNMKANDLMTGFDLKYKLITQMEDKTTAMCYIRWNGLIPEAIVPILYHKFEVRPIEGGGYAVVFSDYDGLTQVLPMEDVVLLRKFYNNRDVSGDGNRPIYNTLSMVKASDEGLMEALSVSNKIRGLVKQKRAMLSPQDVEQSANEFSERFQKAAKNGGIVSVDAMEDFTPLNVAPWSANAAQMREIRQNLFYYWRISPEILTSNYNESQWQAFYEGVLEPILIQMGQAFTAACFTPREIGTGNRILFSSSALINASMQTKVNLLQNSKEIGLFTRNEQREMFGYPPVEGGDDFVVSLNYVKGSDQTKYQIGEEANGQKKDGAAPV